MNNIETINQYIIKPDLIIEYDVNKPYSLPVSVIYVRPKTNIVSYEKAILKGIQSYADVIYLANLSGKLFIKNALILDHYACEYRFSIYGKEEIALYPEMVKMFENHFKIKFSDAKIIGAFDAILLLKMTQQELFDVFVEDNEFLKFHGQTIKKIKDYYIVNYDMPAIISKYDTHTNIFVIAVSYKADNFTYKEINKSIIEEMKNDTNCKIIDENRYDNLNFNSKVKRTYHISTNHTKAMFDMTDFVFKKDGTQLTFKETPFGKILLDNGFKEEFLRELKEYPIVKINRKNGSKLGNIIEESESKNLKDTIDLFKNIV